MTVRVAHVTQVKATRFQTVAGTIRPLDRALVAARVAGTVADANFVLGQCVAGGEVLLTVQANELGARLEQARAAADQAARDAAREAKLLADGASTAETVRTAEDRLRAARAALDEAQTLVSYTRAVAPFPGTVTRKLIDTGDYAALGAALFEIEARERMRAELAVPAGLPSLPPGAEVRVLSGATAIPGRVTEVSPALDPVTRTREVIVELAANAPVVSGDFVRAVWPAGESALIWVPAEAVRTVGQIERVFVVVDGKVLLRIVRTGAHDGERVQIVSGLDAGETVVVSPPAGLRDGQPIRVQP
jgi:RND family efflux transporter MFP subunit